MKKVGIITYHRATNYGAVLQTYSLISAITRQFPENDLNIIDYSTNAARISHIHDIVNHFMHLHISDGLGECRKNFMFRKFSNSLPLSNVQFVSDDIRVVNKYINSNYDIVISGSDAVFSWSGKKFPTAYLLHDIECPKLSYAASAHRLFYKEEPIDRLIYCREAFSKYNYLGVRDYETEHFLRYCGCENKIYHNCDPTLLLDIDKVKSCVDFNIIRKKCNITDTRPIMIVMTPDAAIGQILTEQYGRKYNIISLFKKNVYIKRTIYDLTPFEWAAIFSLASITITEYFHATILSLLNNTPVLAIDKLNEKTGYEGKIKNLLIEQLDMHDLYLNINEIDQFGDNIIIEKTEHIFNQFDTKQIMNKISKERESYLSFESYLNFLLQ